MHDAGSFPVSVCLQYCVDDPCPVGLPQVAHLPSRQVLSVPLQHPECRLDLSPQLSVGFKSSFRTDNMASWTRKSPSTSRCGRPPKMSAISRNATFGGTVQQPASGIHVPSRPRNQNRAPLPGNTCDDVGSHQSGAPVIFMS